MKINPIGINTQIEKVLLGQNSTEIQKVKNKIEFCKKHINEITKINNSTVYNIIIKENDFHYCLSPKCHTHYYYPIQYAEVEFKDNMKIEKTNK